jgi:hypothetical protein
MGISEEQAGVGLGISLLTLVSLVWAHGFSSNAPDERKNLEARFVRWIRLTPWILLLAFMAEICIYEEARLLAAYYPLLFPLLLAGLAHARLVRQPWWQWFGLSVMLLAAAMLVVSRQRPLFPEQMIIAKLEAMYPRAKIFPYVDAAYASPRSIVNVENYFDHDIPRSERVIGYATSVGICEPGLWRPFGERRVKRILPDDSPEELRREGIRYVLVDDIGLQAIPMTIDQWTQRYNGTLVTQLAFLPDRHSPLAHVYLVILGSSTAGSPSGLSAEF